MTDFHVLVPTATTNLITNPSVENATTGWNAFGSAISRVLTRARFGRYSLQVVTNGAALYEGVYFRIDATGINSNMAGSIYARGEGEIRLRLIDGFKGGEYVSKKVALNDDRWTRIEVVGRVGDSNDYRLYVETTSVQGTTFYLDGAQIEAQSQATTYCDGTLDGCRWNGVSHASSSARSAEEMSGGVWTPIRDAECEPDTYVTVFGGFGMPPVNINRQRTALSPGSVFDNLTVDERVLTLQIWVKDDQAQGRGGRSQLRIKELRQILTDLIKPDVSPNTEPFYLKVTDADGIGLILKCRYEGGLEFDSDVRDKWRNSIPLRLLCLDPFYEEDNQEVALLDTEESFVANSVMARVDGRWGSIPFVGLRPSTYAIEEDENGRLYFGGNFVTDGELNPIRKFASFNDDFTQVIERATGLDDDVWDIKAHPNGRIYACGEFLNDNAGNPFDRIVEYNPDTDTFVALLGGIDDGIAYKMSIAPNGDIYVVGTFTTVNARAMNRIARWDGIDWYEVGDIDAEIGNTIERLLDVLVVDTDEIYVCGNSDADELIFLWNGSTWSVLYSGADPTIVDPRFYALAKDTDGTILSGGYDGNSDPGHSSNDRGQLVRYNKSAVTQLGNNLIQDRIAGVFGPAYIRAIDLDENGVVYVGGRFTREYDGITFPSPYAIWNGSVFAYIDVDINVNSITNEIYDLLITKDGDLYLVGFFGINKRVDGAGITSVYNYSTSDVFPIISFTGTGKIIWLENQTTGQQIYFNYTLQENEILTIDFRQGKKTVTSNYRGSVPDAILPNSDDFFLAAGNIDDPKENKIACLIIDEVEPVVQLRYTPAHWSIDAGAA